MSKIDKLNILKKRQVELTQIIRECNREYNYILNQYTKDYIPKKAGRIQRELMIKRNKTFNDLEKIEREIIKINLELKLV